MTRYLKNRKDKSIRHIVFEGERLDMQAVWIRAVGQNHGHTRFYLY